ncbi:MAG: hypothetical protein ABJN26_12125 [Stappiaceae bacterium]
MLKTSFAVVAVTCLCLASPGVFAQEDIMNRDRFVLSDTGDGWLRLDRSNGRVSLCEETNGRVMCLPVPDAATAYELEIERLLGENAALEARVTELETKLAANGPKSGKQQSNGSQKSLTESEEEFDQMMNLTEKAMRRFFGMVRTLQDEFDDRT